MKVKEIQIDGFGVWTGLTVDKLQDGMTLFYGPNEAGKTTLMQFLRAMLYGFSSERRDRYFPPVFGGKLGGAIRVTGQGGGYQIHRHFDQENEGGQLSVLTPDGSRHGQNRLTSLLGQIDESIFTNVFAIGLRELQELSSLDGTEAADELYKLTSGLDRVSLVDVIRDLRKHRVDLVGSTQLTQSDEADKLNQLFAKRERLRSEVQDLTRGGKRWVELASQRIALRQEIDALAQRVESLEHEARCVEVATSIYDVWCQRIHLEEQLVVFSSRPILPEDAPKQYSEIEKTLEQNRVQIESVKEKRREIRRHVSELPINQYLLQMQSAIEAAVQQVPWIEAIDEQIALLDEQLEQARKQVEVASERLGIEGSVLNTSPGVSHRGFPELNRQSLATLSPPAKRVKQQLFLLRQAKSQAKEHRSHADRIGMTLEKVLDRAGVKDLQQAIREHNEDLRQLRDRIQVGEHLQKLKRHYRELERETVELTTAEALPVDRLILLAVPFIFGSVSLVYGIAHVLGLTFLTDLPDPTWGMLCILMGVMGLLLFYFGRENGQRQTVAEREACERQIDSIRKQIRELEAERQHLDLRISVGEDSLELRVREKEVQLVELEATLPTYHQHQAAQHAYQLATDQAKRAATELNKAKSDWGNALEALGLSRSMSPSKVKGLGAEYERLQVSVARLRGLESEREQRDRERLAIAKRIEALYLDVNQSEMEFRSQDDELGEFDSKINANRNLGPLEHLNDLREAMARQSHWLKKRREFQQQDLQLKKQQSEIRRAIVRGEQRRDALWTRCGVESAEQFYEMVDQRVELAETQRKHQEIEQTISKMIGPHLDPQEIASQIHGASTDDLEKRWEKLTAAISESEDRASQLQTQQGETTQEMKHLAADSRLATAKLELACVERKLESTIHQWQILATASFLLDDVCATFEKERQPETLREASLFLDQLTNGKYVRVWTPLGTNQLNVDDAKGRAIQVNRLSRGTREAVFIALRLSLAATYARRGVVLPLVLDDVLVNFDRERAQHAAKTLFAFSQQGHQVLMFTCHQHVVEMFQEIGVETRLMPLHGQPGQAAILPGVDRSAKTPTEEVENVSSSDSEVHEVIPVGLNHSAGSPTPQNQPAQVEAVSINPQALSIDKPASEQGFNSAVVLEEDRTATQATEQGAPFPNLSGDGSDDQPGESNPNEATLNEGWVIGDQSDRKNSSDKKLQRRFSLKKPGDDLSRRRGDGWKTTNSNQSSDPSLSDQAVEEVERTEGVDGPTVDHDSHENGELGWAWFDRDASEIIREFSQVRSIRNPSAEIESVLEVVAENTAQVDEELKDSLSIAPLRSDDDQCTDSAGGVSIAATAVDGGEYNSKEEEAYEDEEDEEQDETYLEEEDSEYEDVDEEGAADDSECDSEEEEAYEEEEDEDQDETYSEEEDSEYEDVDEEESEDESESYGDEDLNAQGELETDEDSGNEMDDEQQDVA